jgi:hypothetical protein
MLATDYGLAMATAELDWLDRILAELTEQGTRQEDA